MSMNVKSFLLLCLLIVGMSIVGCDGGGGPTGPSDAPTLLGVTVNPLQANPGAIIIFSIDFTDISGDLNGGTAVITDSQGNSYQGLVSNASGISGTLTTSITLHPLVTPGSLFFDIFVLDLAGNASNIVHPSITVL
jgi:hypothetical protein